MISVDMVNYSALKQISRIRREFLQSVLRQEMAWFDTSTGGNFVTQLTEYVCIECIRHDFSNDTLGQFSIIQ